MRLGGVRIAVVSMVVELVLAVAVLSSSGVMLDVPFVAQPKDGCGAASIAMVMQYWEPDVRHGRAPRADAATIQRALYSKQARGIFASAMQRYFQDAGYRTFAIHGSWADLKANLEKGRPLIAGLAPQGARDPLHYVVVAGIDWENDRVFVNDPAQRKLVKIGRAEFEKQWAATENWTLLAVPTRAVEGSRGR